MKLYMNLLTQIPWENQRKFAKYETLSASGSRECLRFLSLQPKLLTMTDLCSGPVKETNISFLQNASNKLPTNYFMRTMLLP